MRRREFLAVVAGVALTARRTEASMETGDALLDALDLTRPDLASVKAAVDAGDMAAARTALAAHLRARRAPKWFIDPAGPPPAVSQQEREEADRAVQRIFDSVGIRHAFDGWIDWAYNPTTQPRSPYAADHEWTWQLNRHGAWRSMARAYAATRDPRYGRALAAQMADWIRDNPPPATANQLPYSRWRTIECGIRMAGSWPDIYHLMLRHRDVFPDSVLLAMVDCMRRHADYLDAFPTTGNWLCMEANGEYHVGVLFPEFRDSARWRKNAIDRLRREIDGQVYPDGAQIELSPGYHNVSLGNFLGALDLARLNGEPLPDGYQAGLERMFDLNLRAMSPDRDVPPLNDSWRVDVPAMLRRGLQLFPERKDWAWIASDGKQGAAPAYASCLFPWAGWAVMRSGWDREARFLLMDGGPFGYGHQHEDKLSFVIHAFGARLVFDAGSYAYDASETRRYVLSARGHNVVHVDGLEQRRAGLRRDAYVARAPAAVDWRTDRAFDYAAASFGDVEQEGWGPERKRLVVHTRRVLFVKPDYWIVVDSLAPADGQEHTYESTFHLDAPEAAIEEVAKSVTTSGAGPNLAIVPLADSGLSVRIVAGQEKPVMQGWLPKQHGRTGADPRPCVYYTRRAEGPVHFLYVFAPAAPAKAFPVTAVRPADARGAVVAADIVLASGAARRFALAADGAMTLAAVSGSPAITVRPTD